MKKIVLVSTVPLTFSAILKDQPHFLSQHFDILIVSSDQGKLSAIARSEGVDSFCIPMVRGISPLKDFISIVRMTIFLLRVKPDLVHSYTPKAGLVAMIAGWISRTPVRIHTFTGLIFPTEFGLKKRLLVCVDRLICACATVIVPEGVGVRSDLLNSKITKKQIAIIGNGNIAGVDMTKFSPDIPEVAVQSVEWRKRFKDSNFIFCFVGRLNRDKGIKELVNAFVMLPPGASLLLVGGDDDQAPVDSDTRELISNSPNIYTCGHVDDVRPAFAISNVLVLPSYREGFPNVILQAGAMRLPVIASDINGCNEFIKNEKNGWLVPPKNVSALFNAMNNSFVMPKTSLKKMGDISHLIVAQKFERHMYWERLKSFYDEHLV